MLASKVGASAAIGLTGLIGSGKSHVRQVLQSMGAIVVDADVCAHQGQYTHRFREAALRKSFSALAVYKPDSMGWTRVVQEFGESVLLASGKLLSVLPMGLEHGANGYLLQVK